MATDDGTLQIQSFRVCFDLERRLHKIDQWRIPLPYGLPLRSAGYFAVAVVVTLVLMRLPIVGTLLGMLHPALRYVVLPAGAAYALTRCKIDGRAPHKAGLALLTMRLEPARISAFRAVPAPSRIELGSVTIAPDERGARLRPGIVEGPARVLLRYPAGMRAKGNTLSLSQDGDQPLWRGKQVNLRKGQRMVIR